MKNISIRKAYFISTFITILLSIFILGGFFLLQTYNWFEKVSERDRNDYINFQKGLIKKEVNQAIDIIKFGKNEVEKLSLEDKDYQKTEEEIKKNILNQINRIKYNEGGYILINQYDGIVLTHHRPEHVGKDLSDLMDSNGINILKVILNAGLQPSGGYTEYIGTKNPMTGKPGKKITFVKNIHDWEWLVSAGFYIDNIEPVIADNRAQLQNRIQSRIIYIFILFLLTLAIASIIMSSFAIKIKKQFNSLISYFQKTAKTYEKVDKNKLPYEEFNVLSDSINKMVDVHKHTQEVLRKSEERLSTFMESATDIFILLDHGLNILEINKTGLITLPKGTKKEDIIGKNILEIMPNLKDTGKYEKYLEVIKTGKPYSVDDIILHPLFGLKNLTLKAFKVGDGLGIIASDITERKLGEEALKKSAKEKEMLLQEAHHRIKNNFALISSLLNLQIPSIKYPEDKAIIQECQERILLLSGLHESLYKSELVGEVNMHSYLAKIINDLCLSYKIEKDRISVNTNIEELYIKSKDATTCGILFNELFTNAIKYGFPTDVDIPDDKKGEIKVSFSRRKDKKIEMIVFNNGVPFPEDIDFSKADTLGLQLVMMLVQGLQGTIELDREKGTTFKIVF